MKYCFAFLLISVFCWYFSAQQCSFDYYHKKGGHYLFSTYFDDQNKPREGVCEQTIGAQVYEKRVFKNGHIVSEELNHYNDGKITPRTRTTLNHQAKKGAPIGELKQFYEQGTLMIHWEFYYDETGRRRYKSTEYHANGKLRFIQEYAFIRFSEIDSFNRKDHPPHTVDDFGYSSLIVPFGKHRWYNDQGMLIKEESYDKLSFYDQDDQHLLDGKFTEYHDNGKIKTKGLFKEGNPDGLWFHYHYNGKVYETGNYKNNIKDSHWRQWDDHGKLTKESKYDQNAENTFAPVWEKEYNAAGRLIHSKVIDQKNQAILQDWSPEGKLMRYVIFNNGSQMNWNNTDYRIFEKRWHDNGQLKECTQKHSDTSYVSYFRNGQMERLSIAYWKDTVHFSEQKQWNQNGTLISKTISEYASQYNVQQLITYFPNGNRKYASMNHNNFRKEIRYTYKGEAFSIMEYQNNNLHGMVSILDTISNNKLNIQYRDGLRDGPYIKKDSLGKILKNKAYILGCEGQILKGNIIDRIPKIAQKTWINRANHLLYYKNYSDTLTVKALNLKRDSMAYWLYTFNTFLDSMKYHAEYKETEVVQVWLELPQVYYPKFTDDNNTDPKVKGLKALLDSLGYTWKLRDFKNGNYEIDLMVSDFIHPSMLWYVFKDHWNFVRVQYKRDGENTNDLRLRIKPVNQRIDIERMTPCFSELSFYNEGSMAYFIVYANGEVEIKNRTTTWTEWMEYVKNNPYHSPKDFMWND